MVDTDGTALVAAPGVVTLVLPHLVAGRDLADLMVDRLGNLRGQTVVVDARGTATGSPSFGSQLVHRVLQQGDAATLVMVGAPARLASQVTESAAALGVAARLDLTASLPEGAPVRC